MRKACGITLITWLGAATLPAATLGDVTLPDSAKVGAETLVLNGLGLRSKMGFKVYVGGLYLAQKSSDAVAIVNADAPKRIVMHFVREVDGQRLKDTFLDGFDDNAKLTLKPQIDQFASALETLKVGEEMAITYSPGAGTAIGVKGKDKVTIPGLPFAQAVFGIWLGAKPPSGDLKKGLLGQ